MRDTKEKRVMHPHETAFLPRSPNAENFTSDETNEAEDEIANILSLKLKKPKHWNWELSTSRSCANVALPRILLYDHKGHLLVDVNTQEEEVFREPIKSPERSPSRRRSSRASTVNLQPHSIRRQQLNEEFNGLQIDEATPSQLSPTSSTHNTRKSSSAGTTTTSCIDFYTNDLPDYGVERRSSSLRSVRFKDDPSKASTVSLPLSDLPTPPPSSGTTPTTTSSSGPREKRRYRRSRSSGGSSITSPSILERFSFSKGRFSSPEYAEEHEVFKPPRYVLRSSKAGTLLVQEESFSRCRRRRLRPKHSSSENLHSELLMLSRSNSILQIPENAPFEENEASVATAGLENSPGKRGMRKVYTRRRRSDVGLYTPSSSDDDCERMGSRGSRLNILDTLRGSPHNFGNHKKRLKGVPLHPENDVLRPYGSPTER